MEDPLISFLEESISNIDIDIDIDNNVLEKYYKLFDEKKYIDSNFDMIYNDMKEVYSLDLNSLRYGYNIEEQKIYQALVQAIIQTSNKKNKIKLIPLIVYLDIQNILYYHLESINFFLDFTELKNYFVNTVNKLDVNINFDDIPENHWEKESYDKYILGLKNLEFNKIYNFVEAFERGMGYRFDTYFDFLVFVTYRLFFNDLIEIINKKKDTFGIIYLTHNLSIEETLILARHSNNILLKFEAIRKSVYFNQYSLNSLKNERKLLQKIIINFTKKNHLWQEFLKFYLLYPSRNPQLFEPLSKVVSLLEKDKIDMLVESIKINLYISDDSRTALNSCFLEIENDDKQRYCLEKLFYKWENFINTSNDYFLGIVLTDIFDMVIIYIRDFLDKNLIIKNVEEIIHDLEEINNIWFKNSSEQNNYFYKQMSKLFAYGFAFEKYEMHILKNKVRDICMNSIELQTESHHNMKTTLQLFNEYIFGDIK